MNLYNENTDMLLDAKKAKFKSNIAIQLLIFLLVFIIGMVLASIIPAFVMIKDILDKGLTDPSSIMNYSNSPSEGVIIASLYATAFSTLAAIIYCKFIEKRSLLSMGLRKKRALLDYGIGLFIGLGIFTFAVAIACASGSVKLNGLNSNVAIGTLIIFLGGFLIQGMSEEVVFRGYLMVSLSNKYPMIVAIMVNSVIFSCFHLLNPGVTLLSVINIIMFGVFASIYTLKTDSLWGGCAVHSAWNFVQGNVFGFQVSGMNTNNSLFSVTANKTSSLINGGSFGMEGGLAVTIVLALGIIVLLMLNGRKSEE